MAEHDWQELARDPEVERMIGRAIGVACRTVYPGSGVDRNGHAFGRFALWVDDLEPYLWDQMADVLYRYDGAAEAGKKDAVSWRYAYIWGALQRAVRQHPTKFAGKSAGAYEGHRDQVSYDQLVTDPEAGDEQPPPTSEDADRGGTYTGQSHPHRNDPVRILLNLEFLELAAARARAGLLQRHRFTTETGDPLCSEPGCLRPHVARGLCQIHYERYVDRWGTATSGLCKEPECTRPARRGGRCNMHAQRFRRTDPSRPRCQIPDCDQAAYCRGMCQRHYLRTRAQERSEHR